MATYVNKVGPNKPLITYEELAKHTSRSDCWLAIRGRVIDATPYLAEHPGSEDILIANAGTDATEEFNRKGEGEGHTDYAFSLTEKFWVGNLDYNSPKVVPTPEQLAARRKYTYREISKHNSEEDCWVIIHDKVYDVTSFLTEHPGGPILITDYAGFDATKAFDDQEHSESAKRMLAKYLVGGVDTSSPQVQASVASAAKKGGSNPIVLMLAVGLILAVFFMLYKNNN